MLIVQVSYACSESSFGNWFFIHAPSPSSLQLIMHLLSISKNWKGQLTIWIPSSSGPSFAYVVPLAHLQDPNYLWTSRVSENNFNFKDIANLLCDQQPQYNWVPQVGGNIARTNASYWLCPLLYVDNVTKKLWEFTIRIQNPKLYPYTKRAKK